MTTIVTLYDAPETVEDEELERWAAVAPSTRCVNCGGYAGLVLDEPSPCICVG